MTSSEGKIASLEEKKEALQKKIRGYRMKIAECQEKEKKIDEQISTIRSLTISNLLDEIELPYEDVVELLKSLKQDAAASGNAPGDSFTEGE